VRLKSILNRVERHKSFGYTQATFVERDGVEPCTGVWEPILTKSRWCLLKRPENLTDSQAAKLADLMQYNLMSVEARLLREDFQRFWECVNPKRAAKFLEWWCKEAMRSRLGATKKVARSLRRHHDLILNWFRAGGTISSGVIEGFNGKAKLTTRKAYGFRTAQGIEFALVHTMGRLPEPAFTHRFCWGGRKKRPSPAQASVTGVCGRRIFPSRLWIRCRLNPTRRSRVRSTRENRAFSTGSEGRIGPRIRRRA